MFSLILMAALAGQCFDSTSCSIAPAQVVRVERYQGVNYQFQEVEHQGLVFQVWGYFQPSGKFRWDSSLQWNRNSWDRAARIAATRLNAPLRTPEPLASPVNGMRVRGNFGIDRSELKRPRSSAYQYTGPRSKAMADAARAVSEGKGKAEMRDDSDWPILTVIGSSQDLTTIRKDLANGPLCEAARGWKVQVYERGVSNMTALEKVKFPTSGSPGIVFQESMASEAVLWHQYDYQGGAEQLIQRIRAAAADRGISGKILRPNDGYDESRDPQPGNLDPGRTDLTAIFGLGATAAFIGLAALISRRRT